MKLGGLLDKEKIITMSGLFYWRLLQYLVNVGFEIILRKLIFKREKENSYQKRILKLSSITIRFTNSLILFHRPILGTIQKIRPCLNSFSN